MLQSALRTLPNHSRALSAPQDPIGLISIPAVVVTAERDTELVPQSGPGSFYYHVVNGCVRTVCLLEDGRRQIAEFLFPGDFFETDPMFEAEAITPVVLRRMKQSAIDQRAAIDPSFAAQLRAYAGRQSRAARFRCLVLGRKTAIERVASFLLEMEGRISADGTLDLPMNRTDIADYLGLSTETVCRALTEMRQGGLIRVQRHSVAIVSHAALARAGAEWLH